MAKELTPAEHLEAFLNFIDMCTSRYNFACSNVSEEDKRLQDFLHGIEFASGKAECNRVAGELQESRRIRRENKDEAKLYGHVVNFFMDKDNRKTLNQMRQLLGRQRKEEEYLFSERVYKPRAESK